MLTNNDSNIQIERGTGETKRQTSRRALTERERQRERESTID